VVAGPAGFLGRVIRPASQHVEFGGVERQADLAEVYLVLLSHERMFPTDPDGTAATIEAARVDKLAKSASLKDVAR
jgi:hypothetical protein